MKKISLLFLFSFLILSCLTSCLDKNQKGRSGKKTTASALQPTKEMAHVAKIVGYAATNLHFRKHRIDSQISNDFFEAYLKQLDPARIYFTKEDLAKFLPRKPFIGKELSEGNVGFAFEVFNRFTQRVKAYEAFSKEFLKKKHNLASRGELLLDRSKAPYAANDKELLELWEKRLVNELILLELAARSRLEEEKEAGKKAAAAGKKESGKKGSSPTARPREKSPGERLLKRITQVTNYYTKLEAKDVLEFYLCSFLQVYDPHSAYMSPRTQEDFDIHMRLSLVGIGAVLTNEDGYVKIVQITPGGPADKDGRLKVNDRIVAVTQENGETVDLIDMPVNKAVNYIRGKKDTKVTLSVLDSNAGAASVPKNITIKRGVVKLKDAEASGKIYEHKNAAGETEYIGVITLPSFYVDFEAAYRGDEDFKSSTKDVAKILKEFFQRKHRLDGLIIDLRSNGGGSLMEAVALTGIFIPSGPIVQVRDPRRKKVEQDRDGGLVAYQGPLAVLTNRLSASAAEIFAGAIQDYKRGLILGDSKTHGKGTVQVVTDLQAYAKWFSGKNTNVGSLKLTNAKFYRINGESTQKKGIIPDIIFPSFSDQMELGEEKLEHALEWDRIDPAEYKTFSYMGLPYCTPFLKKRSRKRITTSPKFISLQKNIETFKRLKDRKKTVLDLERRWQEYLTEKKLSKEQEKLMRLEDKLGTSQKDSNKETLERDIYLNESIHIMSDYLMWRNLLRQSLRNQ